MTDEQIKRIVYEHTKLNPNQRDDQALLGQIVDAFRAIEARLAQPEAEPRFCGSGCGWPNCRCAPQPAVPQRISFSAELRAENERLKAEALKAAAAPQPAVPEPSTNMLAIKQVIDERNAAIDMIRKLEEIICDREETIDALRAAPQPAVPEAEFAGFDAWGNEMFTEVPQPAVPSQDAVDAARYRWLRDNFIRVTLTPPQEFWQFVGSLPDNLHAGLAAAIDAAIKGDKP
jgi:hypothetical protein